MLAAFSITPVGDGETVGEQVAAAIRVIRDSGLSHRTAASFTEIEGEWDDVMTIIKQTTDAVMAVSNRCSIVIKADVRPGRTNTLNTKLGPCPRKLDTGFVITRLTSCYRLRERIRIRQG